MYSRERGSTIIEALIAIAIIGVGVFAVIALQGNALRSSKSAVNRSVANLIALDLANRMIMNYATIDSFLTNSSAAVRVNTFGAEPNCGSSTKPCSNADEIRRLMMVRWGANAEKVLPGSKVTICRTSILNSGSTTAPECDSTGVIVIKLWYIDFTTDLKTISSEPESMVAIPVVF